MLQELQEHKAANDEQGGEDSAMETDQNWVEAVAFCTDAELDLAATGTINGEIYIWDVTRKVIYLPLKYCNGLVILLRFPCFLCENSVMEIHPLERI